LPLAGAEFLRARRMRRPDWGVWIALALGGSPLIWRAATIAGVVNGFSHTWAEAYLRQGLEFWETGLAPGAAFAALLLGILAISARNSSDDADLEVTKTPEHEWAAAILLLAIPLVGVIGGLMVTHMFNERYALPGLIGVCLLTPMLVAELPGRRAAAGVALFGVLTWGTIVRSLDHPSDGNPFERETILRDALNRGPVVIPDGQLYLQMWYYAPAQYRSRLIFLADSAAAVKYMGYDTIDGGLLALRGWADVKVVEYAEFARGTREFTLYQTSLRPGWVLARVVADGARAEVKKTALFRELVEVRLRD
jgi:hypothetical protein